MNTENKTILRGLEKLKEEIDIDAICEKYNDHRDIARDAITRFINILENERTL